MPSFVDAAVEGIRRQVGRDRVLCALSGGVDSSVVAALIHRAIGDQLTCLFVDNGLLRLSEPIKSDGIRLPIDFFLRSLAQDQHEKSIAVLLSGSGSDGTIGIREVSAAAGQQRQEAITDKAGYRHGYL